MRDRSVRLLNALYSTYIVLYNAGERGLDAEELAKLRVLGKRSIFRHIALLKRMKLINSIPIYEGFGKRLAFRYAVIGNVPLSKEKFAGLLQKEIKTERSKALTPEEFAKELKGLIKRRKVRADLLGAQKIKELSPTHTRRTHNVDATVIREDAWRLEPILFELGARKGLTTPVHIDRRYFKVTDLGSLKIDVVIDHIRERRRPMLNLRRWLLKGDIPPEAVLLTKLLRKPFRDTEDSYDVTCLLLDSDVDEDTFRSLIRGEFKGRVTSSLEIVRGYLRKTGDFPVERRALATKKLASLISRGFS